MSNISEKELKEVFVLPSTGVSLIHETETGLSEDATQKIKENLKMCENIPDEKVIELGVMHVLKQEEVTPHAAIQLAKRVLNYGDYMDEKKHFKIAAPWTDYPLNDKQIDGVMMQFAEKFDKFYPYSFCMSNFMNDEAVMRTTGRKASLREKSLLDLYRAGYRKWGCVLNTDHYGGGGKHWVCLYGEMGKEIWTIEYFNSSSRAPFEDVAKWIKTQQELLIGEIQENPKLIGAHIRIVTNPNDYQKGEGHHCGVYCLIYIWQRLNEVEVDKYLRKKISNAHVLAFRKYIFQDPSIKY